MDTEQPERPLIQIDDEIRQMNDEEYAWWLAEIASKPGAIEETQPE